MYTGPHIVNDNLVFGYDTGYGIANNTTSTRFYKGEPSENLWDSMLNTQSLRPHTKHYWDGNRWTENSTYTHPGVSGPVGTYLGIVFKHVSGALGSNWGNNSYGYMLRDIACTNGSTMTMSSWIYTSVDCNLDSIPAVIEGEAGGESLASGFPGAYNLSNKGTWQVIAKKATSDGNTRFIPLYPRKNGVTNGSFAGFFMWALPQVTYGNNVVPPIQPGSTRSSTQSLIDLKRTTDIDVSNVSFDSTGQPTFDGTDDYISKTRNQYGISDLWSVELVFEPTDDSDTAWNGLFGGSLTQGGYWFFHSAGNLAYYEGNSGAIGTKITYRDWNKSNTFTQDNHHHLVITYTPSSTTAGTFNLYYNGGEKTDSFSWTFGWNHSLDSRFIGSGDGRFGTNDVRIYKEYSKALTAAEVKQNYNAYKNRFNI
jgi:hypothetical protein